MMEVITLGESMILLSPETEGLMRYATHFSRKIGGAESNFAIGLSRLGHQVGWLSKVGDDEFGKTITTFLRGEGIDISQVKRDKTHSTGIYFKEKRNSNDIRVHYYRKNSAASALSPSDLDSNYFKGTKYLFLTGITMALSQSCLDTVYKAIEIAKQHSIKIVFDPNIRYQLWNEKNAKEELSEIISLSDVVLTGLEEAKYIYNSQDYSVLANEILKGNPEIVVIKNGAEGAYYHTNLEKGFVPAFTVDRVVDPVGAGDGFAAGFISGLLKGQTIRESVKIGNAIGASVVSVNGDIEGLPELNDLKYILQSNSQDVKR